MDWNMVGAVVTIVVTITGAVWFAMRQSARVGGMAERMDYTVEAVQKAAAAMEALDHRLDKIEAQYRPNGGSSMRDAVNKVHARLDELSKDVHYVRGRLDSRL